MDYRRFDLNLLAVFQALFAEGHLTRAAQRLGLSQSATSTALTRLRRSFDDELFVRGRRGMQPTPRAMALAGPIGAALAQLDAAFQSPPNFDPKCARRTFTLGLTDHTAQAVLPRLGADIFEQARGIDLRVRTVWVKSLIDGLDSGEVDLAIGAMPALPARLLGAPLFEERFVGIRRRGSPPCDSVEAFAERPHVLVHVEGDIAGPVDRALARDGRERRIALTVPRFLDAAAVVEASDLVATVPGRIAEVARTRFAVELFEPPVQLAGFTVQIVWHRRSEGDPATGWLRNQVRRVAAVG